MGRTNRGLQLVHNQMFAFSCSRFCDSDAVYRCHHLLTYSLEIYAVRRHLNNYVASRRGREKMTSYLLIASPFVRCRLAPTVSTHVRYDDRKLSRCARRPETGRRTSGSACLTGSIKLSGTYVGVWMLQETLLPPTDATSLLTTTSTTTTATTTATKF